MLLGLVTPAWRRYEMTAACLAQREHLAAGLPDGIELLNIVVANDKNQKIALDYGCTVIPAPNELGRRFNDGIEAAYKLGADWVALVGSDQWVHPSYFGILPELGDRAMTAQDLGIVNEIGTTFAHALCDFMGGTGPRTYPRSLLQRSSVRPVRDEKRMHGLDDAIHRGIVQALPQHERRQGDLRRRGLPFVMNDSPELGPLRSLDFKSPDVQIHPWATGMYDRRIVRRGLVPWKALEEHYTPELVARMHALLWSRQQEED